MHTQSSRILDVPYVSQNDPTVYEKWHHAACGIAVIAMVIGYVTKHVPLLNTLIDMGVAEGGFSEKGWAHATLVKMLRMNGIPSYTQEYKSINALGQPVSVPMLVGYGIDKIIKHIHAGVPVIVSVEPHFNDNAHSHMIVIVGHDSINNMLYYHDPDSRTGKVRKAHTVSIDTFKTFWRKLAIFIDPISS